MDFRNFAIPLPELLSHVQLKMLAAGQPAQPALGRANTMQPLLVMAPGTGERVLRFVGDRLRISLRCADGGSLPQGYRVLLRTNLGGAEVIRREIIESHWRKIPLPNAAWHDIPMQPGDGEWVVELPMTEVGYFCAKAYAVNSGRRQHWPDGPDLGVTIHPNAYRTANVIYCAFVRMFGQTKGAITTTDPVLEKQLKVLDDQGYTVIPPSGKLRDLIKQLPFIVGELGCRILHLLPVNPTPTTNARFGRVGSPYATQDLMAIDPALVEFDKRTTGIEQFCELTYEAHRRGARVFLDLAINHTGWGSTLHENHPEWFLRNPDGTFASPGAWSVVWEDLVELEHRRPALWEYLAKVFLTWCRRGVDGFRCDAGYKVPGEAWRYIIACVRQEFPETIFLLEGLGGSWEATEKLLTEGGMQWAYSELFQNYSGGEVATYLDYSLRQSERTGVYVHYSETHDNPRLAATSREWSLLRNRLCALASVNGAFGFTCGVEWLATEKIGVHQCCGLAWGNPQNLVTDLAALNELLASHPCFFDGAKLTRLSALASPVYALRRDSAEGLDHVLVLVNTDTKKAQPFQLDERIDQVLKQPKFDLLGQALPMVEKSAAAAIVFKLPPASCYCLAATREPVGLAGEEYRRQRARAAWAVSALAHVLPQESIGPYDWRALARFVDINPSRFIACLPHLKKERAKTDLIQAFEETATEKNCPQVVTWTLIDQRRVTPVPPRHWVLIEDAERFRATLSINNAHIPQHFESIDAGGKQIVALPPRQDGAEATLGLERYGEENRRVVAKLRFLSSLPRLDFNAVNSTDASPESAPLVLLTNGLGGMARLCVDLGTIKSKYDCLLGPNLHAEVPVDRHVFAKRARVWVVADGFTTSLNHQSLAEFSPGPPARWRFVASAGDGRSVEVDLVADMLDQRNATVLRFTRPAAHAPPFGKELPPEAEVHLTVRVDIEDRNFHTETHRNPGTEHHFTAHCHTLAERNGFAFTPASDRTLRVVSDAGQYHPEPEWCDFIPHPIEASRGMASHGAAYSPGWFDLPLCKGGNVTVTVSAEASGPAPDEIQQFVERRESCNELAVMRAAVPADDSFGQQLARAVQAFVVRRSKDKTIIAGYPWFLDWGRDSLICARGLLTSGMIDEVRALLVLFGRFAERGTLPNNIFGENASNRDTSDAPLWYGIVCEELAALVGENIYETVVDNKRRTIADVLREVALGYRDATPNRIRMDKDSALIWSPPHFTWMDTNQPAGTPREGYPIEIQVLWIRLLRQLARLSARSEDESWSALADRAEESLNRFYWLEEENYFSDLLVASANQPANEAKVDDALRSNFLFAISLGLVMDDRAQRAVEAATRYLVVPGAVRSLAPLKVSLPLSIYGNDGRLLNNPGEPYWSRYEGDEDTRRKPAYHNGTAWVWTLPVFCEALARAWDFAPEAVAAARAYLGSADYLMNEGCLGQLPEIVDGDAPHTQRGCDAQAWSVTETLRVWKMLNSRLANTGDAS